MSKGQFSEEEKNFQRVVALTARMVAGYSSDNINAVTGLAATFLSHFIDTYKKRFEIPPGEEDRFKLELLAGMIYNALGYLDLPNPHSKEPNPIESIVMGLQKSHSMFKPTQN